MTEQQLTLLFGDLTVVQLVLWIIAACALALLVWKLWPIVVKFVETVNALGDLPGKLALLDEIHHEVRPNTGTSLNDAIRRVEQRQVAQDKILAEHTQMLGEQGERLTGLQALMEDADAELSERVNDLEDTITKEK